MLAVNPFEGTETPTLGNLLMPETYEYFNSSAEEGIFPNVLNYQHIEVPSYQPDYDYHNSYHTTPLVYSWLPIVPGFNQDGFDNLHHFQHINEKLVQEDFEGSQVSDSISNQNEKYRDHLVIYNQQPTLLNNQSGMEYQELENSCNAMDLNISCSEEVADVFNVSFNGTISKLLMQEERLEVVSANEEAPAVEAEVEAEEERLRNESLELLKQEDSSRMLYINEKSPDVHVSVVEDCSDSNEPAEELNQEVSEAEPEVVVSEEEEVVQMVLLTDEELANEPAITEPKPSRDCDSAILKKLQMSMSGVHPPPSVTTQLMSLSEMLATYKKNLNASKTSSVTSSSFFVPSHKCEEVAAMEWPATLNAKCFGVAYNKSSTSEDIEAACLRYGVRFVGAETFSSFNLKVGPISEKKRLEKLK